MKLIWWMWLIFWKHCVADTELPDGICRRNLTGKLNLSPYHFAKDEFRPIPYMYYRGKIEYPEMIEESTVFVDKSLLIKRILETKQKVIVITCPASFGKTINLSMLKYFFEIRVRGLKKIMLQQSEMSTYKFFTKGIMTGSEKTPDGSFDSPLQSFDSEDWANWENMNMNMYLRWNWDHEKKKEKVWGTYINPPMISRYTDIIDQHLGNYCVIYFDFNINTFWEVSTIYENLKEHIARLYSRHIFLKVTIKDFIASNRTTESERRLAEDDLKQINLFIQEHTTFNSTFGSKEWENSVVLLSRMLKQYIGKPVIILLDDCYSPLEYYFLDLTREGSRRRERKKRNLNIDAHISIMRNFIRRTFKQNPYLSKAVIMGTLPVNHKDLFAHVFDYARYNVINNDLQEFFGFTDNEVGLLFDHYKLNESFAQQAYSFYRGYTPKQNSNLIMYNAKSIVYFLNEKYLEDLWVKFEMTQDKIAARLPGMKTFAKELQPLVDGNDVIINYTEAEFSLKPSLLDATFNKSISKQAIDCALSIFYQLGFFTISQNCKANGTGICVRIPNEEIKQGIIKRVLSVQ